jgi:hypothetical protein
MRSKGTVGADDGSERRRAGRGFRSVIPVTPSYGELCFYLHEMIRRDAKKGLASLCIGGGMGVALAVER